VVVNRAAREKQPLGDVRIAESCRDEAYDLELSCRQAGWVCARGRTWPPAKSAGALFTKTAGNHLRRSVCAELNERVVCCSLGVLVVGPRHRHRCVVGAVELAPFRCGRSVVSGQLERERLGYVADVARKETRALPRDGK
jgi:hypothetical protein